MTAYQFLQDAYGVLNALGITGAITAFLTVIIAIALIRNISK